MRITDYGLRNELLIILRATATSKGAGIRVRNSWAQILTVASEKVKNQALSHWYLFSVVGSFASRRLRRRHASPRTSSTVVAYFSV